MHIIGYILLLFIAVALLARYPASGIILAILLAGVITAFIFRKKLQ